MARGHEAETDAPADLVGWVADDDDLAELGHGSQRLQAVHCDGLPQHLQVLLGDERLQVTASMETQLSSGMLLHAMSLQDSPKRMITPMRLPTPPASKTKLALPASSRRACIPKQHQCLGLAHEA